MAGIPVVNAPPIVRGDLLRRQDLASLFAVSQATIYRWIAEEKLPLPVKRMGRTAYWHRSQFRDVLLPAE